MALSKFAQKLVNYLGIYKITTAQYKAHLAAHPKAKPHGLFAEALEEAYAYGY
jgi:hypothetical protein